MSGPQRIAIVGGGAAGALAAIHLLREPRERGSLEIELIDRGGTFGSGVAYGTRDPLHLLNVPAVRMGAIAGHPEHFHEWLAGRGELVAEAAFMPRGVYGTYIRDVLAQAERGAEGARLRRRGGEVASIASRVGAVGAPLELTLADGERLEADKVVLALGPLPGQAPIDVPDALREGGVYVADPWAEGALEDARSDRDVLIVGTGLSMVDVAVSLCDLESGPRVRAVSRHGLVPRHHRRDLTNIRHFHIPTGRGLEPILAAIFGQIGRVAQQGDDWRDVIDSIRPVAPQIWKSLRIEEKRRFLADLQRLWDVHRYRMAPPVADRIEALRSSGRVRTEAHAIVSIEPYGRRARVALRTPGAHRLDTLEVDRVINCSGAGSDLRRAAPALLAGLFAAGDARPDELGMGLDVDADGALLDADGVPSERLFALGALRKGVEWETLGVTEIRDQCGVLARRLVAAGEREASPEPSALRPSVAAPSPTAWEAA
ncbi:MAG TPA: FAD/NAD(P)-binding protein [Solirubrobacterales bacterium]|nr:FAD/NAD(P)-binding protein [Solirubrobacterales bacterium]